MEQKSSKMLSTMYHQKVALLSNLVPFGPAVCEKKKI